MSRLTLEWHLRGIRDGTTEPECVRKEIEPDEILGGWDRTGSRYYTDPSVEGYEEYDSQARASSYTTGFTQENGEFCDCFDVDAHRALQADDTVVYLDMVTNDPTVRYQRRHDAAQLLNHHIWPEPRTIQEGGIPVERDDIEVSEWIDKGMTGRTVGPMVHPVTCENPRCGEGECLADPDVLRDTGRAECMVCGTVQSTPNFGN